MKSLTITTPAEQHTYPIHLQPGLLKEQQTLQTYDHYSRYLVLSNKTVANHYLNDVIDRLPQDRTHTLLIGDGEQYKSFDTYVHIINRLIELQFDRNSCLITLGGGVITDMGGYVASTFCRGIDVIHIPTTLLAQVDASIGNKTAINHPQAKNMIGTFYPPKAVLIDSSVLTTLPKRQLHNGMAEVIKAACIKDTNFMSWLEQNTSALKNKEGHLIQAMIEKALRIKADIVQADPYENGDRRLLNFGHTLGHAIEQYGNYNQWLHGEAVSIGMVVAAKLSQHFFNLNETDIVRLRTLLNHWDLPTTWPTAIDKKSLFSSLSLDKKSSNNTIKMILLQSIGCARWQNLTANQIINMIND